jgi:hypothetical protein
MVLGGQTAALIRPRDFKPTNAATAGQQILDELQAVSAIVSSKATADEIPAFKQWLLTTAQAAADAAKEGGFDYGRSCRQPCRRGVPNPTSCRLRQMATGITATTSAGHWPGPGPTDQRLLQIARNLSRARILVERYGGDVHPPLFLLLAPRQAAFVVLERWRICHRVFVIADDDIAIADGRVPQWDQGLPEQAGVGGDEAWLAGLVVEVDLADAADLVTGRGDDVASS